MFYFYGYTSAFVVYSALNYFWPYPATKVPATIYDDLEVISAGSEKGESDSGLNEKTPADVAAKQV